MADTTTEVRAEIEQTRARMAGAIAELEKKADIAERVRERPWVALAIAFGAGLVLSRSRVRMQAPQVAVDATRQTGSRLGSMADQVVTAAIGGVVGALHSRVDDVVSSVVRSVRRDRSTYPVGTETDSPAADVSPRAD